MKYNEKYDRYVTKGGLVYRYNAKKDRLIQCKLFYCKGYLRLGVSKPNRMHIAVHRLVYETFVGEIPNGYEIDHINTIRDDNRLDNLRCVTSFENNNNPLTRKHRSETMKGRVISDFGKKFKEHFGFTKYENPKLYFKEHSYFHRHKKCSWEK